MASHAEQVTEKVNILNQAGATLSGWAKIVHHYETAFVHALAGAEQDAETEIAKAETEIANFAEGTFAHLKTDLALLEAKVHAVLSNLTGSKPAAKKPAAAKAKDDSTDK